MSTQPADSVSSIDTPASTPGVPAIETRRFERAVTTPMDVERVADRFYHVANCDGKGYDVDLATGACSCPDAEHRGDEYVCKHAIRASLVETFAHTVSSALVARVVAYARDHGCPVDGHGGECAGPVGGNRALPCPTCCDAARSEGVDEYDVWMRVVAPYEVRR